MPRAAIKRRTSCRSSSTHAPTGTNKPQIRERRVVLRVNWNVLYTSSRCSIGEPGQHTAAANAKTERGKPTATFMRSTEGSSCSRARSAHHRAPMSGRATHFDRLCSSTRSRNLLVAETDRVMSSLVLTKVTVPACHFVDVSEGRLTSRSHRRPGLKPSLLSMTDVPAARQSLDCAFWRQRAKLAFTDSSFA